VMIDNCWKRKTNVMRLETWLDSTSLGIYLHAGLYGLRGKQISASSKPCEQSEYMMVSSTINWKATLVGNCFAGISMVDSCGIINKKQFGRFPSPNR
jgi:hypothetical protein